MTYPSPCMDYAVRVACEYYSGAKPKQISKRTKVAIVCGARQFAWAVMHATGRFSYPQLGRMFGGFDHSTVMRGVRMMHETWGTPLFQKLAESFHAQNKTKLDNLTIPKIEDVAVAATFIRLSHRAVSVAGKRVA